ncbi:response regulator [Benzoatithermus flavus]|uniref:Response regulator n=1 Tax=Benzoatithermus flavus TaxID=3108223 RepID=A0ABU8XNY5_9PROT
MAQAGLAIDRIGSPGVPPPGLSAGVLAAPMPEGAPRATDSARPLRVLIVEDELIIAWEIAELLVRLGCEVCGTAADAMQAIRLAGELAPDLVLMDVRLRGKGDGITAAEAIRAQQPVSLVFCTAHAEDPVTRARMQAAGAVAILAKPIEPGALEETLIRLTGSMPA